MTVTQILFSFIIHIICRSKYTSFQSYINIFIHLYSCVCVSGVRVEQVEPQVKRLKEVEAFVLSDQQKDLIQEDQPNRKLWDEALNCLMEGPVQTHTHTCTRTVLHTHTNTHSNTLMHTHTHTVLHTHTLTHITTCSCTHTCTHTVLHTTCTHTHCIGLSNSAVTMDTVIHHFLLSFRTSCVRWSRCSCACAVRS